MVEEQGQKKVEEYLDSLPEPERVKGVVMDMHEAFRQAVQMCLPQAKVVVDKLHLIRHINRALDDEALKILTSSDISDESQECRQGIGV